MNDGFLDWLERMFKDGWEPDFRGPITCPFVILVRGKTEYQGPVTMFGLAKCELVKEGWIRHLQQP